MKIIKMLKIHRYCKKKEMKIIEIIQLIMSIFFPIILINLNSAVFGIGLKEKYFHLVKIFHFESIQSSNYQSE